MSSSRFPGQGPGFVPAYQVSGTPFAETKAAVTHTTAVKFSFPTVTRWVTVSATDAAHGAVRIGFTENGVNSNPTANYYLLELEKHDTSLFNGSTERLELRCKELWVRGESTTIDKISVVAGLTGIHEFPVLSGSNGFKGVG